MKIRFDFSLFTSPSTAYGHVEGEIDVDAVPPVGIEINLLPQRRTPMLAGLHRMRVEQVIPPDPTRDLAIVMLNHNVLNARDQARQVCSILEKDGFRAWPYDDD
jgi:predicted RNA binding protein YcfA (HicA-like mRNA interferase family)